MYIPELFRETEMTTLYDFMRSHSFATVVTARDGRPFANHLPLFLDSGAGSQGALIGHRHEPIRSGKKCRQTQRCW